MAVTRRRRRRSKVPFPTIVIIFVLLILLLLYLIGTFDPRKEPAAEAEKTSELADYAREVSTLVKRSNTVAAEFREVWDQATSLSRIELEEKLNKAIEESNKIAEEASGHEAPPQMLKAQTYLQLTFDLRAEAIDDYRKALFNALEDINVDVASSQMSRALLELHLSDRAYRYFTEEFRLVVSASEEPAPTIPNSSFLGEAKMYQPDQVQSYIANLKREPDLEIIRGVALLPGSVQFSPGIKTREGGYHILLNSPTLAVTVAVQNQGNQVENNVPVTATLKVEDDTTPRKKTTSIEVIQPGETKTVTISGIPTTPGVKSLLTIMAGTVVGEKFLVNNKLEDKIIVEAPAPAEG
ncbi:hypothetical protein HKBW3S44_00830 [Candidatus Hakubella thermalkaliphila]|uniref:CARDB domain-containing protein n=1 Tax=Candidatus Hakubella thermalkaliphila TaxID=2754717 RepID=A0A6V8PY85_9ACTN|nr:CARDB domain-containing protein [Candidatus Hakubella thermalkaliphila]GFP37150.1 hypothetical protein HKBW3S44_00830 [Candidatus Hakubella thermalkaliphila]